MPSWSESKRRAHDVRQAGTDDHYGLNQERSRLAALADKPVCGLTLSRAGVSENYVRLDSAPRAKSCRLQIRLRARADTVGAIRGDDVETFETYRRHNERNGSHQFHCPSTQIVAGTSRQRINVASRKMAIARPKANRLDQHRRRRRRNCLQPRPGLLPRW